MGRSEAPKRIRLKGIFRSADFDLAKRKVA